MSCQDWPSGVTPGEGVLEQIAEGMDAPSYSHLQLRLHRENAYLRDVLHRIAMSGQVNGYWQGVIRGVLAMARGT